MGGFQSGVRRHGGGDEDDGGVYGVARHRFLHRVVDGHPQDLTPSLARGDPGHDLGAVGKHLLGVELPLPAGDALDQDPGLAVHQDHAAPPTMATMAFAASMDVGYM